MIVPDREEVKLCVEDFLEEMRTTRSLVKEKPSALHLPK
jgi:hypothetical protein